MNKLLEETGKEKLLDMYRKMVTIRQFEDKLYLLFLQNELPGSVYLSQGQEATAVGIISALNEDDYIMATHRCDGEVIAKGIDLKAMMAEEYGKVTGICKGKGSWHFADVSKNILPSNGIIGAGIPHAAGAALACKLKKNGRVAVSFFGDGGASTGPFHEGMNLAALWKAPAIFVCVNNQYAATTSVKIHMSIENVADRAVAYGFPGIVVDGNDVLKVYETAVEAVKRARAGEGPTLIECKTYRRGGHSRSDAGKYRPKEEVEEWLARDPIPHFEKVLTEAGMLNEDIKEKIAEEVAQRIDEAVEFARESESPSPESTLTDVFEEVKHA